MPDILFNVPKSNNGKPRNGNRQDEKPQIVGTPMIIKAANLSPLGKFSLLATSLKIDQSNNVAGKLPIKTAKTKQAINQMSVKIHGRPLMTFLESRKTTICSLIPAPSITPRKAREKRQIQTVSLP